MSMIRLEDILQLSVAERLDLMEKIWDSITAISEALPLTEAQCAELDRRMQAHSKNPEDVETWNEVKARIRQRK
jgi:putative addiction module component (TIGR02574 family)